MKKDLLIASLVFTVIPWASASASGPGTAGADVLNMGVGARAIGMGEAFTAQADDVSSLYWNPAGLALMNQSQASFMYNQGLNDLAYQHAGIGLTLENGAVGGGVSYLSYGNIAGYDAQGNPGGSVNAYSGVGTLDAAWLGGNWSLGANVKGVQTQLADVRSDGVAFDVGGIWIYPSQVMGGTIRAGGVVQNMGSGMKFLQETDPFPTQWRLGLAGVQMLDKKLNVSCDYGKPRDDKGALYTGLEYWIYPMLALRAGYAGGSTEGNGIRAGIGLRYRDVSLDYAYANYGDLGMTHRYELTYHFGEIRPLLNAEERRLLKQAKVAMHEERYADAVLLLDSLVNMEPHYRYFQRLEKVAMAGNERQEKLATGRTQYHYETTPATVQHNNLVEMEDLTQLLQMSDTMIAQGQENPTPNPRNGGVQP